MRLRTSAPLLSVVVPVYDVESYLGTCLESVVSQSHDRLEVVVVDDGSTDRSGDLADSFAALDPRVRVVHTANHGLGAARNTGVGHAQGDLLTFVDSDDVVPPGTYAALADQLRRSRADLVTGDIARLADGALIPVPWMTRLHPEDRSLTITDRPDLLGDVFAWNKVFRRSFWDDAGLTWPEGVRYEDQPTTTEAFLAARRIAVSSRVVYHWRTRSDGSSITQQRASVADLQDRWTTKRMTLDSVRRLGSAQVSDVLLDRILPADLWRYFVLVPDADDAWWDLLVAGVRELWPDGRLTASVLPPVHRLIGWLVGEDRRADAVVVAEHLRSMDGRRIARVEVDGGSRLDVPGLDPSTVDPSALVLRPHEA